MHTFLYIFRHFLPALKNSTVGTQNIGAVFCKFSNFFRIYIDYCNNYDDGSRFLQESERTTKQMITPLGTSSNISITKQSARKFQNFLRLAKNHPQHTQLNLSSFLILPVQRLPRYKLLMLQVLENTPRSHPDFADCKEAEAAIELRLKECNEEKRRKEQFAVYQRLTSRIHSDIDLTSLLPGEFETQGLLTVLKLVELRPSVSYPILDPTFACNGNKSKYTQKWTLSLWETRFGHFRASLEIPEQTNTTALFNVHLIRGKQFYFYKFQNFMMWCKRKENQGMRELICILPYSDDHAFELVEGESMMRFKSEQCLVYFTGAELKKWVR